MNSGIRLSYSAPAALSLAKFLEEEENAKPTTETPAQPYPLRKKKRLI